MADNITFQTTVATPPSGQVVATDDVAGVHFQKVKIDVGGDGASTILSTSNPLPVAQQGTVTVSGTVTANLSATTYAGMTALTADYDSGGGTQNMPLVGVAMPGAGGGVAGGTFTNPFRVDPTGTTAQPVTDNGGSLTVDGTVGLTGAIPAGTNNIGDVDIASIAAGDTVIGRLKLTDGTTVADVFDYTNSNPLAVRLTDTNGDYVSAGGGGTQYTVDAASTADPVGNALILRRRDTLSGTEVSADGDNIAANATSKGELYVKHTDAIPVTDNGGSLTVDGSVSLAAALPAGTNNIGDVDVLTVPADPFGANADAASATGSISAKLRFIASTGIPITGTVTVGSHAVTNAGTFAVQESGAALTALQLIDNLVLAEDAAHVSADPGVQMLAVRKATPANLSGADGDYEPLQVSAGRVWASATIDSALPAGSNTIGGVTGNVAHDGVASGNPVTIAGEARSTDRTAVADADVARIITTLLGKTITQPYASPALTWNYAAASGGITNTTGVTAKAAAGAGVRNYVTMAQVINGHATVDTDVQIRDGASGTVLWRGFAKAAGGGVSAKFDPPLRGSANTLLEIACGTTGSATYVNLQGYVSSE